MASCAWRSVMKPVNGASLERDHRVHSTEIRAVIIRKKSFNDSMGHTKDQHEVKIQ